MKLRLGDFYRDISNDVEARFNARDFDTDHSSGTSIPTGKNKKSNRYDEAGKIITDFVGLRAKLYSYTMAGEDYKKCKGV